MLFLYVLYFTIIINDVYFFKDFIYLFLERGREGEREGEKHQCVVATHTPFTGDLAHNPGWALTGIRNSDPLVHRPGLKPLSHSSHGYK